jgi:hypothetical protein
MSRSTASSNLYRRAIGILFGLGLGLLITGCTLNASPERALKSAVSVAKFRRVGGAPKVMTGAALDAFGTKEGLAAFREKLSKITSMAPASSSHTTLETRVATTTAMCGGFSARPSRGSRKQELLQTTQLASPATSTTKWRTHRTRPESARRIRMAVLTNARPTRQPPTGKERCRAAGFPTSRPRQDEEGGRLWTGIQRSGFLWGDFHCRIRREIHQYASLMHTGDCVHGNQKGGVNPGGW